MTFTDLISKRIVSHPTESLRRSSLNNEIQKKRQKLNHSNKHHHNHKLKCLHTSVLDLLHWHQPTDILENNNKDQEQSLPHRPSIIKSSDIAKVLSKKSVTFASTFDLADNEHDVEEAISNLEINTDNKTVSEEDLVTVITNRQFNDEITVDSNKNIEPYPFRSEIPLSLSPQLNLPVDDTITSHHSPKKIINHFVYHRKPKKLRHPIQIIDPVNIMNRSSSAPNLIIPPSLSPPPTTTITTNDKQTPLTTIRIWFKSSSLGRFVQSFGKTSHQNRNTNNISNKKTRLRYPSTELKQFSNFIY